MHSSPKNVHEQQPNCDLFCSGKRLLLSTFIVRVPRAAVHRTPCNRYGEQQRFADPTLWTARYAGGDRDALVAGPQCPQPSSSSLSVALPRHPTAPSSSASSEDCLYLNVWKPHATTGAALPVMVWVHGGSFLTGNGDQCVRRYYQRTSGARARVRPPPRRMRVLADRVQAVTSVTLSFRDLARRLATSADADARLTWMTSHAVKGTTPALSCRNTVASL